MILSDKAIKQAIHFGDISIEPFNEKNLGSNSYDLHLSEHVAMYNGELLDAAMNNELTRSTISKNGELLRPNELYLMSTIERTGSKKYVPMIEGKSSVARLGIQVHLTAGFGDVGFDGHFTLEVIVTKPVIVYAGMPIAQIYFQEVSGEVETPYNTKKSAKYNNQSILPQESKMYRNKF